MHLSEALYCNCCTILRVTPGCLRSLAVAVSRRTHPRCLRSGTEAVQVLPTMQYVCLYRPGPNSTPGHRRAKVGLVISATVLKLEGVDMPSNECFMMLRSGVGIKRSGPAWYTACKHLKQLAGGTMACQLKLTSIHVHVGALILRRHG